MKLMNIKTVRTKAATAGIICLSLGLSLGLLSLGTPIASAAQQSEVQNGTLVEIATTGSTKINAKLKGYVFGLRIAKVNVTGTLTDDTYAVRADLFTSGVGAFLKKFQIWATTTGRISDDRLRPIQHIQQNIDKKNRRVEMNYSANDLDISIVPRLGSQGKPPATKKQRFESDDVLTAVLNMAMRGFKFTDEPCTGSVPVFDSKQHYLLRMELAGSKKIKQKGFKGETIRCKVYYVPVSGFDPEDLPSEEEVSAPVVIYLTKNEAVGLYIPVKMTYKISFFHAVVKLRELNITQN